MEISDQVRCLFSAYVEEQDGSYVIAIPEQELDLGTLSEEEMYRVAVLSTGMKATPAIDETESTPEQEHGPSDPPVEEGERREVDIVGLGEQGDGIARVENGYVVIIPETEKGDRVTIEITDVQQNVAFAEIIEKQTHF